LGTLAPVEQMRRSICLFCCGGRSANDRFHMPFGEGAGSDLTVNLTAI